MTTPALSTKRPDDYSKWYRGGMDICFYEKAHDACLKANANLKQLDLSTADRALLAGSGGSALVAAKIRSLEEDILSKTNKGSKMKRVTDLANTFCEFAARVTPVLQVMVPQSPEYNVPFGCVALIFKLKFFDLFKGKLTTAQGKLVDALVQPLGSRFETYINNIEASKRRIFELRDAACTAQQTDMKVVIDDMSSMTTEMKQEMSNSMIQIASSVSVLHRKMEEVDQTLQEWRNYQATNNANLLIESLFADILPDEDEISLACQRSSKLSPKDHWENNGILDHLRDWSDCKVPSLLWIGGQCGNQDPWVTGFVADLVSALGSQEMDGLQVPVFLQDNQVRRQRPIDVLRMVITRFIERRPTLLVELPNLLNSRTLRRTGSFSHTCRILKGIAQRLEATFIIIDRFDLAETDQDDVSATDDLLPQLLDLAELGSDKVRILLTSNQEPPSKWRNDTRLSSVWLDTGIRPGKRDHR